MSATIDQKMYLQKYLAGPSGDKKKKKKKISKGKGFKIIDDDIDLSKLRPLDGDELDILGEGEDAPQIAGIIDERPEEIRKLEQFKTNSKWRVINQDDGFNSKLKIEEIKRDIKDKEKDNELIFGKMYSDSEEDSAPVKKQPANENQLKKSQNNSDSDFSPPRRNKQGSPKRKDKGSDSDLSPPRQHEVQKSKEKVRKASRWGEAEIVESNSPDRSRKRKSLSPHIESRRKSPDSDQSPPRKYQKGKAKNSNVSPSRKSRKDYPRKRNHSSDSDQSPPRKRRQSPNEQIKKHQEETKRRHSSDMDSKRSQNKRKRSPSPQRNCRKISPERNNRKRQHDSDSDLSPPRREKDKYKNRRDDKNKNNVSPPPSHRKMTKTLDGKQAGLQDAAQLRLETESFRRREEEAFRKMTDEVSGRNAQVVSRKGKRETSEERQKLKEKAERQRELDEKYKRWGKGLKQLEAQERRVQDYLHEAAKPLARHKDDKDLEGRLKDVERAGDPMLQYIKEKKRERGELGPEKPSYKGSFPPNRFNIRPGYRWDGVDRSNGYEKKYFEQQSKKKAQEEEAYKWSTEDL